MTTIETTIQIDDEGKVIIRLPSDMKAGAYRAVLVFEGPERPATPPPLTFSAHDVGPWPEGFAVRREENSGDDGR